jgi:4-hydroxymandelate oxidase
MADVDPPDPGPPSSLDGLVRYEDFAAAARRNLPREVWDYYASGSLSEWTLHENEAAYRRWRFARRVLVDVSRLDIATTVLGTRVALPVLVAPTAFQCLADPAGEVATAGAARGAGTIMVVSTLANRSLEDVAATGVDRWFQLYIHKDRGLTRELVARAEAAGYTAIVPTLDTPRIGIRYADQRNRFQLPEGLEMGNLSVALHAGAAGTGSGLRAFSEQFDDSIGWDDLAELCAATRLPVVAKGIVAGEDAALAVDAGCAGVIVSNHGGRQLDGDPGTLEALPEVAAAVGGRGIVLVDGGVRRGTDVVKALALGARAVLVGRPILWGLAAGGEAGVARVLRLLADEVADTLRQLGVARLDDLGPHNLRRTGDPTH